MSTSEFAAFFANRVLAANAYASGDFAPLEGMLAHSGAATFHSPRGDTVNGAGAVARRYREDAESFAPGGDSKLEVMQMGDSGDLAFWTGYQLATVRPKGAGDATQMRIRVTEVFGRAADGWRLIHRHADTARQP